MDVDLDVDLDVDVDMDLQDGFALLLINYAVKFILFWFHKFQFILESRRKNGFDLKRR